jgi:hypothetical protein
MMRGNKKARRCALRVPATLNESRWQAVQKSFSLWLDGDARVFVPPND